MAWYDNYTDAKLASLNEVQLEELMDDIAYDIHELRTELSEYELYIDEYEGAYAQDFNEPEGSFEFRAECLDAINNYRRVYDVAYQELKAATRFEKKVTEYFEATDYYKQLQAANEAAMASWWEAEEVA